MAAITTYKKKGSKARKRKYEGKGKHEELSVKDVVIYRHKMGRHIPGMSDDMVYWYDFWYFTRPNKAKDGDKYERHVQAWERRSKWFAEEGIETLGSSRKVIPYRRRAHS